MRNLLALPAAGVLFLALEGVPAGEPAWTHDAHRLGLRVARRLDEKSVRLSFGSSFVPKVGEQAATYRLVSATDPVYQAGVRAQAAQVERAPDDDPPPPPGYAGRKFERFTVTLTLPKPLQAGHRHAVQALGVKSQPVTGGRAAAWIEDLDDAAEARAARRNGLGVRSLEILAPTVVQLTVGAGLDAARADGHPENVVLRSADDPAYKAGVKAQRLGRRTRGDCFYTDGWPYGSFLKHELFAVFEPAFKQGCTYTLDLNAVAPLTCGRNAAALRVDDRESINPALKVNQIGYLPSAKAKYAYLGAWLGSLGPLDYGPWLKDGAAANRFEVRDAATHAVVLTGACKLRHRAGEKTETVYKEDATGEDVYELDLSALKQEGRCYVAVPGLGRSFEFRVAPDAYVEPFRVLMTGVLHQRCGLEMKQPYSDFYRPACHRNRTELTDWARKGEAADWKNLSLHVKDPQKHDLFGGHHDAGDYNPRAHLEVARRLHVAGPKRLDYPKVQRRGEVVCCAYGPACPERKGRQQYLIAPEENVEPTRCHPQAQPEIHQILICEFKSNQRRDAVGGGLQKVGHRERHPAHRRHVVIVEGQGGRGGGDLAAARYQVLHAARPEEVRRHRPDAPCPRLLGVGRQGLRLRQARVADVDDDPEVLRRGLDPPSRDVHPLGGRERCPLARRAADERPKDAAAAEHPGLLLD